MPQYSGISKANPNLARESAIEQERDISETSSNLKVYKSAIHHAAVQISRRPKPDRVPHTSIGTVKESKAATEAAAVAKASHLSIDKLKQYCMSESDFLKWGYPDPNNPELQHPSDPIPPGGSEGTKQLCDRCKVEFVVSPTPAVDCRFHSGRVAPERVEGRRKWIYSCCKLERGSAGCQEGFHVFADRENDVKLSARVPFKYAKDLRGGSKSEQSLDVLGLDCEMICELNPHQRRLTDVQTLPMAPLLLVRRSWMTTARWFSMSTYGRSQLCCELAVCRQH